MDIRRTLLPFVLVAAATLAGCGGGDDDSTGNDSSDPTTSASGTASSEPTEPTGSGGVAVGVTACELLSADEVAAAVGSPVKAGVPRSGEPITGGTFTSCQWMSDDPDNPADSASLYLYSNTAAADSAREDDSEDIDGIGDGAFSVSFAGVWVYAGEQSLLAQWYTFSGSDEDNLPRSEALAQAAVDKLAS